MSLRENSMFVCAEKRTEEESSVPSIEVQHTFWSLLFSCFLILFIYFYVFRFTVAVVVVRSFWTQLSSSVNVMHRGIGLESSVFFLSLLKFFFRSSSILLLCLSVIARNKCVAFFVRFAVDVPSTFVLRFVGRIARCHSDSEQQVCVWVCESVSALPVVVLLFGFGFCWLWF